MRIISIGEILWDVIDSNEYLGGAPFNFCAHAVRLGHDVRFVSAVGSDARGRAARARAAQIGVNTEYLGEIEGVETGVSYVSHATDSAVHRLPRPVAYDYVSLTDQQLVVNVVYLIAVSQHEERMGCSEDDAGLLVI